MLYFLNTLRTVWLHSLLLHSVRAVTQDVMIVVPYNGRAVGRSVNNIMNIISMQQDSMTCQQCPTYRKQQGKPYDFPTLATAMSSWQYAANSKQLLCLAHSEVAIEAILADTKHVCSLE